jgi:maltooligosyltrehalose synthase
VLSTMNEPASRFRNVFTGVTIEPDETRTVSLTTMFEQFPVALLIAERPVASRLPSPSSPFHA